MSEAHVTSVDAIESFRSSLISYLGKTRPLLDDACDEVFRLREWIERDRRLHWENEIKRRRKLFEAAEQALFSARLGTLREATGGEHAAVMRARRALNEAEEKLRMVKKWALDFDNRVQPLVKELDSLRTMLANDLPRAVLMLAQIVKTLDAYAGVQSSASLSIENERPESPTVAEPLTAPKENA
ncbi:MAG TPA: hypothetical protein VK846_07275 [Candidatus Limnocylindria bacterium]|nr:hypothetical protein [Candidatus Limnocylindria bacterium]